MRYWKCIESGNENKFTVDEIYSTWEDGDGLIADNGETGWINPSRMSKVAKFIEVKEEGENKMEDLRELIKPCYLLVLKDGTKVKTLEIQSGIVIQYADGYWDKLSAVLDKIEKVYGFCPHGAEKGEFSEEDRPLIYERKSPTQLN